MRGVFLLNLYKNLLMSLLFFLKNDRKIVKIIRIKNSFLTGPQIRKKVRTHFISNRIVHRRLTQSGIYSRRLAKKLFLKSCYVKYRLTFAKKTN